MSHPSQEDKDAMSKGTKYTVIRDKVLGDLVMLQLNKLREPAEEKDIMYDYGCTFETLKKQYVEYLIAACVASTIAARISPPEHVDELWHLHLLETESYMALCTLIINYVKEICPNLTLTTMIHHSSIDNKEGREDRLKEAKSLYKKMGYNFVYDGNDDEDDDEDSSDEEECIRQQSKKRKVVVSRPRREYPRFRIVVKGNNGEELHDIPVRRYSPNITTDDLLTGVGIYNDKHGSYDDSKFEYDWKQLEPGKRLGDYNIAKDSTLVISPSAKKAKEKKFSILVKITSEKTITLSVRSSTTIFGIKIGLHLAESIPLKSFYLTFAGRHLEDERTLGSYNVGKVSTLDLLFRLVGC